MTASLGISAGGMVSGVGLSLPASCAAIRCAINNFAETRFVDRSGAWIIGSEVPLEEMWRGLVKLAKLAASAVKECLEALPKPLHPTSPVPLILCIAEEDRPGRLAGLGGPLLFEVEREAGVKFHPDSSVIPQGRVGGAIALLRAQKLIQERHHDYVIVAGVDSYLHGPTLAAFDVRNRLLTTENSDGFIPGEAAAAVLVCRAEADGADAVLCHSPGFARESATIASERPFRADGMVEAMRAALAAAAVSLEQVDHRMSDVSGEQYRFKELALATSRILRHRKEPMGIWHPADSIGEIGAAALPAMLCVLFCAARKRYLPGQLFMAHLSNDDEKRAALVVSARRSA